MSDSDIDQRLEKMWPRWIEWAASGAGIGVAELKQKLLNGQAYLEIKAVIKWDKGR